MGKFNPKLKKGNNTDKNYIKRNQRNRKQTIQKINKARCQFTESLTLKKEMLQNTHIAHPLIHFVQGEKNYFKKIKSH